MGTLRQLFLAAALCALVAPGVLAATPYLDEDVSPEVKRWAKRLNGLRVEAVRSERHRVVVDVQGDCELHVAHPAAPACDRVRAMGNSVVCFRGPECPPESRRSAALSAAGRLNLPWRMAEEGEEAEEAQEAVHERLEVHRLRLDEALEAGDREGAREALAAALETQDAAAEEWLDLLVVAPALGHEAAAWDLATGPRTRGLSPEQLATQRVALLMGPAAGVVVAAAVMDRTRACGMAPLAKGFLRAGAAASAADLADRIRRAAPDCFEAWAVATEAYRRLGAREELKRVTGGAFERFEGDPRLADLRPAFLVTHGKAEEVVRTVEEQLREEPSDPLVRRALELYLLSGEPETHLERLRERVEAEPEDHVARLLAGAILVEMGRFEEGRELLKPVGGAVSELALPDMYRAIAAFATGEREAAEAAIDRAAKQAPGDARVHYVVAEIYRDTNPERAVEGLTRYLEQSRLRAAAEVGSRRRARDAAKAVAACREEGGDAPCPGPWRYGFDMVHQRPEPLPPGMLEGEVRPGEATEIAPGVVVEPIELPAGLERVEVPEGGEPAEIPEDEGGGGE